MQPLRAPLLLTLVALTGCSGAASRTESAATRARASMDLIGYEELQEHRQYSNLYDLIDVLRPRWLRPQGGPDTLMGPQGQVQIHMDGNRLGDVGVLRQLSPAGVTSIRWLAPIDAAARYGLDHSHGAIVISTRPVH